MTDNLIFILGMIGAINLVLFMTVGVGTAIEAFRESKDPSFIYLIKSIYEIYEELTVFGMIVFSIIIVLLIPSILLWHVFFLTHVIFAFISKISFKSTFKNQ